MTKRLPRHSVKEQEAFTNTVPRNDVHVKHLLTYLPTNLLTSKKRKTKVAFTLAEVLITLTIIGVVAALTMPSLIAKYEKQQTLTALKKNYSVLQQAFKLAEIQNGKVNNWDWSNAEVILNDYLGPHLKIIKNYGTAQYNINALCEERVAKKPENRKYVWLSGQGITSPFYADKTASVLLADGVCIGINPVGTAYAPYDRTIFIDTNGVKGPNMAGKDLFFFMLDDNGNFVAAGHDWSDEALTAEVKGVGASANSCNTKSGIGGRVCAERIIREGWEINYY